MPLYLRREFSSQYILNDDEYTRYALYANAFDLLLILPLNMMFISILLFKSNRVLASKLQSWVSLKEKMPEISYHFVMFFMMTQLKLELYPILLSAGCFNRFSTQPLFTV